jgi:hypothetical protein
MAYNLQLGMNATLRGAVLCELALAEKAALGCLYLSKLHSFCATITPLAMVAQSTGSCSWSQVLLQWFANFPDPIRMIHD